MKNTKNQDTMWVVQNKESKKFFNKNSRYEYTNILKNALVLPTREQARAVKCNGEVVKKVIAKKGTPIRVID